MNRVFLILTISFLTFFINIGNCQRPNSPDEKLVKEWTDSINIENLVGNWALPEYIDSTIKHKGIYKFSPGNALMAYGIKIPKLELVYLTGFMEGSQLPLMFKTETMAAYGFDDTQYWTFRLVEKDILQVQEYREKTYYEGYSGVPKTYFFRRTLKLPQEINQYFAENIIAGKYLNLKNKKIIEFTTEGKIINHEIFSGFDIEADFVSDPPGYFDILYLYAGEQLEYEKMFHWYFENDTLILKSLKEIESSYGRWEYVPDKIIYKLLKQYN